MGLETANVICKLAWWTYTSANIHMLPIIWGLGHCT